jgi:hypothetical protein
MISFLIPFHRRSRNIRSAFDGFAAIFRVNRSLPHLQQRAFGVRLVDTQTIL